MYAMLTEAGHDVVSALQRDPRAADDELLAIATDESRILITEDKDFGELVFVRGLTHPCIIRFVDMSVSDKAAAMQELIDGHADAMREPALIVVTRNRVRVRRRGT